MVLDTCLVAYNQNMKWHIQCPRKNGIQDVKNIIHTRKPLLPYISVVVFYNLIISEEVSIIDYEGINRKITHPFEDIAPSDIGITFICIDILL